LDEKSAFRQLDSKPGFCHFTISYSRLHGQVPRTLINLNSSMSALALVINRELI
jgi:hypothetical protein